MSRNRDEEEFTDRVKAKLDQTADPLDANTLTRLQQIRLAALARAETEKRPRSWLPVGGVLAATAALALFLLNKDSIPNAELDANELDILASSDEVELYEDLEFYQWLDADEEQS